MSRRSLPTLCTSGQAGTTEGLPSSSVPSVQFSGCVMYHSCTGRCRGSPRPGLVVKEGLGSVQWSGVPLVPLPAVQVTTASVPILEARRGGDSLRQAHKRPNQSISGGRSRPWSYGRVGRADEQQYPSCSGVGWFGSLVAQAHGTLLLSKLRLSVIMTSPSEGLS